MKHESKSKTSYCAYGCYGENKRNKKTKVFKFTENIRKEFGSRYMNTRLYMYEAKATEQTMFFRLNTFDKITIIFRVFSLMNVIIIYLLNKIISLNI